MWPRAFPQEHSRSLPFPSFFPRKWTFQPDPPQSLPSNYNVCHAQWFPEGWCLSLPLTHMHIPHTQVYATYHTHSSMPHTPHTHTHGMHANIPHSAHPHARTHPHTPPHVHIARGSHRHYTHTHITNMHHMSLHILATHRETHAAYRACRHHIDTHVHTCTH